MCYITHSLRFTSGETPADLLAASMAAELSLLHGTITVCPSMNITNRHVGGALIFAKFDS